MPPYDKGDGKRCVVLDGELKVQVGEGCLSDQRLGQCFAELIGLDLGLPLERVKKALQAIFKAQFQGGFSQLPPDATGICAINDEQG
jgi:hypothetical protein